MLQDTVATIKSKGHTHMHTHAHVKELILLKDKLFKAKNRLTSSDFNNRIAYRATH